MVITDEESHIMWKLTHSNYEFDNIADLKASLPYLISVGLVSMEVVHEVREYTVKYSTEIGYIHGEDRLRFIRDDEDHRKITWSIRYE